MRPLNYLVPSDLKEACSLLSSHKDRARIIAGGQTLTILMRKELVTQEYLIDIKNLESLAYIKETRALKIGANTTLSAIEASQAIKSRFPIILQALEDHDAKVKNWATIGGHICTSDPKSDLACVLLALGASVTATSSKHRREVVLEDFFNGYFSNILRPDEILTEVSIPYQDARTVGIYRRNSIRAFDMPLASVAAVVNFNDKPRTVKEARIAMGGVGPTPLRAREAEKLIQGKLLDVTLMQEAATCSMREAKPDTDLDASADYRRKILKLLVESTLKEVSESQFGLKN